MENRTSKVQNKVNAMEENLEENQRKIGVYNEEKFEGESMKKI